MMGSSFDSLLGPSGELDQNDKDAMDVGGTAHKLHAASAGQSLGRVSQLEHTRILHAQLPGAVLTRINRGRPACDEQDSRYTLSLRKGYAHGSLGSVPRHDAISVAKCRLFAGKGRPKLGGC